jgi:hypothetical protein
VYFFGLITQETFMHWLCCTAIVLGLVFVLIVGLMSVLQDLVTVHDSHINERTAARARNRAALAEEPSSTFAGGSEGDGFESGVRRLE